MSHSPLYTKYYIIAGEASGDLHGSNLIKNLFALNKNINIQCWGGDKMQQAGGKLVKHYKDLAFMGFVEVIKTYPLFLKIWLFVKKIFWLLSRRYWYL